MAQIKIYALNTLLANRRQQISDILHHCMVQYLGLPENKRFHRFFPMQKEDFIYPDDRSDQYTILEISMFQGRSETTRKLLIRGLFEAFNTHLGIHPQDLEITIFETPQSHWGIRGLPGDELKLNYKVNK